MTSKVSISAHAGLPVRVSQLTPGGGKPAVLSVVEAGGTADYYVHAQQCLFIAESQPDDTALLGDVLTLRRVVDVEISHFLDGLNEVEGIDKRWISIARTNIEQGFLAIERAVRDVPQ